ncbi:MAG: transporter substrate-binding domain-containing protein [Campylobacter sp.]
MLLKKDDELTAQINSALKSLKQKGVLKEISLKYFGKDITE